MKRILSVDYYNIDATSPDAVDARVHFAGGEVQVFYEEADLAAIQAQIQKQQTGILDVGYRARAIVGGAPE